MFDPKILLLYLALPVAWSASINDVAVGENSITERDDFYAAIKTIAERLDRWDDFYMGRLEPRMVGAATSLANLDSNIKNLQERAHVWDTFQLHVSSWNDQIKALDHKMNIINEGYEKLLALDSALYSALKPNGSLHGVELQLARLDEKVESLGQGITRDTNTPIVSEFANRGVLHTLKIVERKLDRIQMAIDRNVRQGSQADVEEIKCLTPIEAQDILRDITSRMDNVFDKNDESQIEMSTDDVTETRHMGRACKKLMVPQKRLLARVEYLRSVIQDLVGDEPAGNEKSQSLRNRRRLRDLDDVKDTLEDIERGLTNLGRQQDRNINENEKILRRLERKIDSVTKDDENDDDVVLNRLKRLENLIKKVLDEVDDDSDENGGSKKSGKDDTDEDTDEDDDDNDSNDKRHKKGRKNDTDEDTDEDTDAEDDDNDSNDKKHKKSRKNDTDEDTDEDDDDNDSNDKKHHKKGHKNDTNKDTDEDDDDNDSNDKKHHKKGHKNDTNEDTDEDDNNDTEEDNNSKDNDNDSNDDDDDDKAKNGRRGHLRRRVDKRQTDAPEKNTESISVAPAKEQEISVVQKLLGFTQQE